MITRAPKWSALASSLFAINAAVVFTVWILTGGNGSIDFQVVIARALVFANLTGFLGLTLLRRASDERLRRLLSTSAMVAGLAGVTVVGCLIAQVLVTVAGFEQAEHFLRGLLQTLRIALPVAIVFGLGALFHESLHGRIRCLEEGLQVQEMLAEQNCKLAAEARLRSLEARIHPHFLFNTLNSISSLIVLDPGRAERVVSRLAALLRSALDDSPQTTITLREELGLVESYLDIECIRFGDRLRWSISVAPDTLETHVPRMAVLSLAENSVKHAITARGGGAVDVVASIEGGDVHVEVRDTGPGFELKAIRPGHGLDSLVSRLDAQFGGRAHLNVERRDGYAVVEMVVPHL